MKFSSLQAEFHDACPAPDQEEGRGGSGNDSGVVLGGGQADTDRVTEGVLKNRFQAQSQLV